MKEIIVTEKGAAFKDIMINGEINDENRIQYFREYLRALLRAKLQGINITCYFAWTLTDNFEWSEGYWAHFGLIREDRKTQLWTIKHSGHWFRDLLSGK